MLAVLGLSLARRNGVRTVAASSAARALTLRSSASLSTSSDRTTRPNAKSALRTPITQSISLRNNLQTVTQKRPASFSFFLSQPSTPPELPPTGPGSFSLLSVATLRDVPDAAKWLGIAGLAPFVACAALSGGFLGMNGAMWSGLGMSYGATILTFLGGPYWGLALSRAMNTPKSQQQAVAEEDSPSAETIRPSVLNHLMPDAIAANPTSTSSLYALSVVPSLVAWFATSLPLSPALYLLSASHAGMLAFDLWMVRQGVTPGWYANLRVWLGTLATLCLFWMIPESEWWKKRKQARKEQKELELAERKRRVAEREAELARLAEEEKKAEEAVIAAKKRVEERREAERIATAQANTQAAAVLSSLVAAAPEPAKPPSPAPESKPAPPKEPSTKTVLKAVEERIESGAGEKAVKRVIDESAAKMEAAKVEAAKAAEAAKAEASKVAEAASKATETAKETGKGIVATVSDLVEKAEEKAHELVEKAEDAAHNLVEKAKHVLEDAKEAIVESVDRTEKVTENATKVAESAVAKAAKATEKAVEKVVEEAKHEVAEIKGKVDEKVKSAVDYAEEVSGGMDTPATMLGTTEEPKKEEAAAAPAKVEEEKKEEPKKKAGPYSSGPWNKKK